MLNVNIEVKKKKIIEIIGVIIYWILKLIV